MIGGIEEAMNISTHSLTRRLTEYLAVYAPGNQHFNSQPHKEADSSALLTPAAQDYFNSQPHKEAD